MRLIVIYPIRMLNDVINFKREYYTSLYLLHKNHMCGGDEYDDNDNNNNMRAACSVEIETTTIII